MIKTIFNIGMKVDLKTFDGLDKPAYVAEERRLMWRLF